MPNSACARCVRMLIRKNPLYVPPTIQYADNLRNVILDPIKDDVRICRE
jgi:hypothetical protein